MSTPTPIQYFQSELIYFSSCLISYRMIFINDKKEKKRKIALCDRKCKKNIAYQIFFFSYLQIYNLIIHIVFIKIRTVKICIANIEG